MWAPESNTWRASAPSLDEPHGNGDTITVAIVRLASGALLLAGDVYATYLERLDSLGTKWVDDGQLLAPRNVQCAVAIPGGACLAALGIGRSRRRARLLRG